MMSFRILSSFVFTFLVNFSVVADFYPNQDSGIQINLPPFWKTKATPKFLQSSSKDNLVILRMSSTSAKTLPLKLKNALQNIQEQLVEIEYITSPEGTTRSLNDLKVTYIEGKGIDKRSKKPSQWSVAVATHKQTATISIIATKEGNEKHASVIGKIVQSLSKIE